MVKNLPVMRDSCLIPHLGRSFGDGNGNSVKYSFLGNPMDRGAWVGGGVLQSMESQKI